MTDAHKSSDERSYAIEVEDEVRRRLEFATQGLRRELSEQKRINEFLEFKLAVAEWAVAGVLARNLRLNVRLDPAVMDQAQNMLDVAERMGATAGHQFLRGAELNFKLHADMAQLKSEVPPHTSYRHTAEEGVPHPIFWPRPFK
jgi:hypothetical protein